MVTIKTPSDGTCTQWSLERLLVMVHELKGLIKPPCDSECTQGSLYSLLVMVHVLNGH